MPSTKRRRQSGQSLVEPLVAAALLGIGVVAGLTAADAGTLGANRALGQQRALCVVRTETEYISSADWRTPPSPYDTSIAQGLTVVNEPGAIPDLARITISYTDPRSQATYSTTLLKSKALSGPPVAPPGPSGCPST